MHDAIEIASTLRQWFETITIRSMHDWRRYVKATGLSMPQFGLLMFLYHGGACDMRDIRERMEITSAATPASTPLSRGPVATRIS